MKNEVQLIAYVDRLGGGGIAALHELLKGPLRGLFGGLHLLPFYDPIDGQDAGFDPIDHLAVDPRLGSWEDVLALSRDIDLMADVIVNHVSTASAPFQDWIKRGEASRFDGMFLTFDGSFPGGATEADLTAIYRPRPGLPFSTVPAPDGSSRVVWTTFTPGQVDINVAHPEASRYLESILERLADHGVSMVRLDAAGYAVKRRGSSCFLLPETFKFIDRLAGTAGRLGMEVLVEVHAHHQRQRETALSVDRVYDFALPPLVLHAIYTGEAEPLRAWLQMAPRNAITVLDTHDGIGVIDVGPAADEAGLPGLLPAEDIDRLVETIHKKTDGQSRRATGAAASNVDLYQVNTTYYDALGRSDRDYLAARALQFFAPGVPQVYYVGLLAAGNDTHLMSDTGVGRDINRHYFRGDEVERAIQKPVVKDLMRLIRFRNTHAAFGGRLKISGGRHDITLHWSSDFDEARLAVNFLDGTVQITATDDAMLLQPFDPFEHVGKD